MRSPQSKNPYRKVLSKIISSKGIEWVHFCYVPVEIWDAFSKATGTNGFDISAWIVKWENVANKVARSFYLENGAASVSGCYEKNPVPGAELMRSKYCIRYQFGACLKSGGKGFGGYTGPLYLRNNGYSLKLEFDCANCEMVVTDRL